MPIRKELTQGRVPVKIWTDDLEERAQQQFSNQAVGNTKNSAITCILKNRFMHY